MPRISPAFSYAFLRRGQRTPALRKPLTHIISIRSLNEIVTASDSGKTSRPRLRTGGDVRTSPLRTNVYPSIQRRIRPGEIPVNRDASAVVYTPRPIQRYLSSCFV